MGNLVNNNLRKWAWGKKNKCSPKGLTSERGIEPYKLGDSASEVLKKKKKKKKNRGRHTSSAGGDEFVGPVLSAEVARGRSQGGSTGQIRLLLPGTYEGPDDYLTRLSGGRKNKKGFCADSGPASENGEGVCENVVPVPNVLDLASRNRARGYVQKRTKEFRARRNWFRKIPYLYNNRRKLQAYLSTLGKGR